MHDNWDLNIRFRRSADTIKQSATITYSKIGSLKKEVS